MKQSQSFLSSTRALSGAIVVLLASHLALLLCSFAPSSAKTVEATQFVLIDAAGRARATIGMDGDSPSIVLSNGAGGPVVQLTADPTRSGVHVLKNDGSPRAALCGDQEGGALIVLTHSDSTKFIGMGASAKGANLSLVDGDVRVVAGASSSQAGLNLWSNKAESAQVAVIAVKSVYPESVALLDLRDENGTSRLTLQADKDVSLGVLRNEKGEIFSEWK